MLGHHVNLKSLASRKFFVTQFAFVLLLLSLMPVVNFTHMTIQVSIFCKLTVTLGTRVHHGSHFTFPTFLH